MTKNNKVKVIITTKEDTDHYEQEKRRILDMTYKEEENLIDCLAKEWNLRFGRPIDDARIKEEFREGNIDIMILRHYFDKEKFPDDNSYRDFYYRKKFWTVEEASILLLDMNPERFDLTELHKANVHFLINKYNDYLRLLRDGFDTEQVLVKNVINWSDQNRIELPKSMQVFFKTELIDLEEQCRKLKTENKEIKAEKESLVNQANELEEKNSSLSSQVLELTIEKESLIKQVNELQEERTKLLTDIETLNKKVVFLEEDKPNTKNLKSYTQIAMGMLAVHYGREQVNIWQDWVEKQYEQTLVPSNKSNITNKSSSKQKDLLFTKIEEDLADLNVNGIKIKKDAISNKIKESIDLLKVKKDIKH